MPLDEAAAAIGASRDDIVVIGDKGSVFVGGDIHEGRGEFPHHATIVAAQLDQQAVVIRVKEDGDTDESRFATYRREKFEASIVDDLRTLVRVLPQGSQLRADILVDRASSFQPDEHKSFMDEFGTDQTNWMRIATIAATIYFVQLLVRLYQYSIRLAAFWDSRADATLLGQNFSDLESKPKFDELVAAIGPDSFDFKPPRFSYLSWRSTRKESD